MRYRYLLIPALVIATSVTLASANSSPAIAQKSTMVEPVTIQKAPESVPTPVVETPVVQPVIAIPSPPTPTQTPQEAAYAVIDQLAVAKDWPADTVTAQKQCLDLLVTNSIGWSDPRLITFTQLIGDTYISYCAGYHMAIYEHNPEPGIWDYIAPPYPH